ncbi:unnamed protein product [Caenorhabditis auriculariae]|uniref:C2H2-type domain-containing protein n=1 Tax=Caenorhabditis auriculariae TaxID=2777116 RepID=A0A8S1GMT2_9PELO|nr:unnamed protein product [Caenorhabditis auriculariae]
MPINRKRYGSESLTIPQRHVDEVAARSLDHIACGMLRYSHLIWGSALGEPDALRTFLSISRCHKALNSLKGSLETLRNIRGQRTLLGTSIGKYIFHSGGMIGYPIVFRCCECTVEEPNLEHLESHIWSRHVKKFPFNCALCDYPAMNYDSLAHHFATQHPFNVNIEFKRRIEDEKRLREMIAESITVQIFEGEDVHSEEPPFYPDTGEDNVASECAIHIDAPNDVGMSPRNFSPIVMMPTDCGQYKLSFSFFEKDDLLEEEQEEEEEEEEDIEQDESIEYVDEEGNPVYIEHDLCDEDYSNHQVRVLRNRRLQKTINNVALGDVPGTSKNTLYLSLDDTDAKSKKRDERYSFACDVCGKMIKYYSKLIEHKRSHDGERPFACMYCPARFTQNGALKCHIRLHTGERPYPCTWECGKSFASSSARALHEKTHSGERSFMCVFMRESFHEKNSHCNRHLKNVHAREIAIGRINIPIGLEAVGDGCSDRLRELVNSVIDDVREDRQARENENVVFNVSTKIKDPTIVETQPAAPSSVPEANDMEQ